MTEKDPIKLIEQVDEVPLEILQEEKEMAEALQIAAEKQKFEMLDKQKIFIGKLEENSQYLRHIVKEAEERALHDNFYMKIFEALHLHRLIEKAKTPKKKSLVPLTI